MIFDGSPVCAAPSHDFECGIWYLVDGEKFTEKPDATRNLEAHVA